jgi:LmbE family N-acetylglucosaminyl deacetylase
MKILAIGAHPDDIEAGCGGTLAKYAQNGHEVHLLIMTEGDMGGDRSIRRKEQFRSAKILKSCKVLWGGYKDTLLTPHMNQMVHEIEAVLKKIAPDFILVHHEDDTHQDHRSLSKATVSATRYIRNVLFYEGPTTQNFSPTIFVDIKDTLETKLSMLLAHRSQVRRPTSRAFHHGHCPFDRCFSRHPGEGAVCGGFCPPAPLHQCLPAYPVTLL